eukprot:750494-Hanusia_phi.AAC.1
MGVYDYEMFCIFVECPAIPDVALPPPRIESVSNKGTRERGGKLGRRSRKRRSSSWRGVREEGMECAGIGDGVGGDYEKLPCRETPGV